LEEKAPLREHYMKMKNRIYLVLNIIFLIHSQTIDLWVKTENNVVKPSKVVVKATFRKQKRETLEMFPFLKYYFKY